MKDRLPQLGLVCISVAPQVRYRTITRKNLLKLTEAQQEVKLRSLYEENLQRLEGAIDFCLERKIYLYRLKSSLFPFADTPMGAEILADYRSQLAAVGEYAAKNGVRLILHPPQFVVLNSDSDNVVANSIKILAAEALVMDYLGLPRTPWAAINIHGGKGDRAEKLIENIKTLPPSIRTRLTLENDEHTYGAEELLEICQAAGVPLVFDAHHHVIHEDLDSYEHQSVARILAAAKTTWPNPEDQVVHISNGRDSFGDPKHSDYIYNMPSSYQFVPWIEIEAKKKELAVEKLQQEWLPGLKESKKTNEAVAQAV